MRKTTNTAKIVAALALFDLIGSGFRHLLTRRRAWLVAALLLIYVGRASAATDPCQSLLDQISSLRTEQRDAERDFQDEDRRDGRKPLASQVSKVRNEYQHRIDAKVREYDQCRLSHGGKPDEPDTFTGTATMTTSNQNAQGPFTQNVTIRVKFLKYDHTGLEITNFPTITVGPFTTPAGQNTTTVTQASVQSASAVPDTGKISINMTLHFRHSLPGAGDSDLPIIISTDNPGGSRVNQGTRHLKLVGTGTFREGFLGNSTCTLVIDGSLAALP